MSRCWWRSGGRTVRSCMVLVSSLSLAGCVTPGSYWHREGAAAGEARADLKSCAHHLQGDPSGAAYSTYTPTSGAGSVGGAFAVGLAGGLAAGIAVAIVRSNNFKSCMREKGYEHYAMTNDEQQKLSAYALDTDRQHYIGELMSMGGTNVRLGFTKDETDAKNSASNCPANQVPCIPEEQGPQLGVYDLWKTKDCPANRQPC